MLRPRVTGAFFYTQAPVDHSVFTQSAHKKDIAGEETEQNYKIIR